MPPRPVHYSMCLVLLHFSEIARPLLYCVVPLWHEVAMVLFFRTLCSKPEYGLWTCDFACYITLTAPSVIQNFQHLVYIHSDAFRSIPTPAGSFLDMLRRPRVPRAIVPQVLLVSVLKSLPMVKTVLLQLPVVRTQEDYSVLCAQIQALRLHGGFHNAPFEPIRTLLLQGDPNGPADGQNGTAYSD